MSVLDFLKERDDEPMTGYYYTKAPKPGTVQETGRVTFHYSKATARQQRFGTVITNVRLDSEIYTIRTCDDCGFKIGGYVFTQNGLFWIIEEIHHDEQTKGNEEALLLWRSAVKTEFILRLRRIDNPWGIGT